MNDEPEILGFEEEEEFEETELVSLVPEMEPFPEVKKEISATSLMAELQQDDVEQYNVILKNLRKCWQKVHNVDDVCKLALTHTKVMDMRSKMLFPRALEEGSGGRKTLLPWND